MPYNSFCSWWMLLMTTSFKSVVTYGCKVVFWQLWSHNMTDLQKAKCFRREWIVVDSLGRTFLNSSSSWQPSSSNFFKISFSKTRQSTIAWATTPFSTLGRRRVIGDTMRGGGTFVVVGGGVHPDRKLLKVSATVDKYDWLCRLHIRNDVNAMVNGEGCGHRDQWCGVYRYSIGNRHAMMYVFTPSSSW